jgi:hypothetical protein
MNNRRVFSDDLAQTGLLEHLAQTEHLLRQELRKIDHTADCEVIAAADLGIPYDAIRLSGGFATGCFVQWNCRIPVVPIDITMNIDTSSVFWVSESSIDCFTKKNLSTVRDKIEMRTGYEWNFDEGNHFITLTQEELSGCFAIIIHSNEREFKNQYNGLCPTDNNWFARDVVVSDDGRLRLLVGRPAEIFVSTSHMLEPYNIARHRFVLHELLSGLGQIEDELHVHHYYMPSISSAALGCYIVPPGQRVPIFSQPGKPIIMYAGYPGGPNTVQIEGQERCVIPHGFGIGLDRPLHLIIRRDEFEFQDSIYPRQPRVSLLNDPSVMRREFPSVQAFLDALTLPCPGKVVGIFRQLRSLTQFGFQSHE